MPVTELTSFECSDSFLISFAGELECTFDILDDDTITAAYGTVPFSKEFVFTRGSNTAGKYDEHVAYSVDGAAPTINQAPTGVTFIGGFRAPPAFNTMPKGTQTTFYEGSIEINEATFIGTRLGITVTIGFVP